MFLMKNNNNLNQSTFGGQGTRNVEFHGNFQTDLC